MNRTATTFFATMLLGLAVAAGGHEGPVHKEKPVEGEVKAVAGDRITLQSGSSTLTVVLDDRTKLERGDKPATKADLKPGEHLSVFGTRLGTGELAASEIMIGAARDAGKPDEHMGGAMPMEHSH